MQISSLDQVKELEQTRDTTVRALESAQVHLSLMSTKDRLLENTWKGRCSILAQWADEVESHCNAMIDVLLNG